MSVSISKNRIILADNLQYMKTLPEAFVDLVYTDVPFNTKKQQKRTKTKGIKSEHGLDGFGGNKYVRVANGQYGSYQDSFDDYIGFLKPRVLEIFRVLKPNGSLYLHVDYREAAYVKIMLDEVFGRENFVNEIIWCYDYGAKSKTRWSAKHDNIFYYVKDRNNYTFNYDKIPRIPYVAPALVGPEKAARGKIVVDWWVETIVPTNSKEKQNYATQKPLRILNRIVEVSSNPGDVCLDPFAGSGSFGQAAYNFGRKFVLIDNNIEAFEVMKNRFKNIDVEF
jgi:site-specific DNA-methyltransferase (adenine-specific)